MTLFLPMGPPGSGKTTLRNVALEAGFPPDGIVCPDDYRRILTGDESNQKASRDAFKWAGVVVDWRMQHGLPTWIDATNLDPVKSWGPFVKGQSVVLLPTPQLPGAMQECRRRNLTRERVVPEHVMDRMIDRYMGLDLRGVVGSLEECGASVYRWRLWGQHGQRTLPSILTDFGIGG